MALRLVFVSHSLPPPDAPDTNIGGMQRVASELHAALARHPRVDYEALVMRSSWAKTHRRVVPFLLRTLVGLRRRIGRERTDAILFSSMVSASLDVLLARARRKHGVRSASIVHGLDVTTDNAVYQRFVPRVFRALDLVTPVSRATGEACVARGLPPDKLRVVPNGVDVSRFNFPEAADFSVRPADRPSLRNLIEPAVLLEARLVLCSVGRHVARKGFGWFVREVMPLLPDDVVYVLAGEGPESAGIALAAKEAGVARRVVLAGRVSEDDLRRLYAGADLFVMPNIHVPGDMEGFGVVLLEAGLSGAPAIAAGIEGILDVIEDGQNGVLVESANPAAFVAAIRPFYDDHRTVVAAARRAREYTESTFGWEAVADRFVSVLEALVARE